MIFQIATLLDVLSLAHLLSWLGDIVHRIYLWVRGVNLQLRDLYPECSPLAPTPPYIKSKVRFILTNKSKDSLIVNAAKWQPRPEGLPIQPQQLNPTQPQENDPVSTLQLESTAGWELDPASAAWQAEALRIEVPPNRTFRVYVGLQLDNPDPERRATEIRRRYVQRRLGTLILPVKKHGQHEVHFKLKL
jgi:hypothetical protein